ncbi:hypothetical protein Pmi06nite_75870 [Planotetraspora mira]|uniref:Uncharacterized protein n=1 Tax=Planotetraspora mira TaxID=58121 RepID=A0A8J3XAN8_9ACTN|nr:hypothetical protein Pmi06nite_75870 [Planotetraspora mira]
MFDPDLIVAWLAEVQHGSTVALRKDIAWASGAEPANASRWMEMLDVLGIVDISWASQTWRARPLTLTPLPGRYNVAVLAGARPDAAYWSHLPGVVFRNYPSPANQLPLPASVWMQWDDLEETRKIAAALGAEPVSCVAETIARRLDRIALGELTAPPARTTGLARFDNSTGNFLSCAYSSHPQDGLYEYKLYGRLPRYATVRNGSWYAAGKRIGIHLELPSGSFPLQWRPDSGTRDGQTLGQLIAPYKALLPKPQEEAAVMCTGLPPLKTEAGRVYDGVPRWIAGRIAQSLRRNLEIR